MLNSTYLHYFDIVLYFFQERVKAWQAFQALSMNLNKKREAKVKAELAQRMDKISILRQEIIFFLRTKNRDYPAKIETIDLCIFGVTLGILGFLTNYLTNFMTNFMTIIFWIFWRIFWRMFSTNLLTNLFYECFDDSFANFLWQIFWRIFLTNFCDKLYEEFLTIFWHIIF